MIERIHSLLYSSDENTHATLGSPSLDSLGLDASCDRISFEALSHVLRLILMNYLMSLETLLDKGTQWAVFEPNAEALWASIRRSVSDLLFTEWRKGALKGANADEAYFVRCDRSTMTQDDIDNGRLVCIIGVAIVRPAEFVILRIGQFTANATDQ
jgi:phage tail sheath protein FI